MIKGLDLAFGRKCSLCKKNKLPVSPDYVCGSDGVEIPICKECGDIMDAMHGMRHKARDDTTF